MDILFCIVAFVTGLAIAFRAMARVIDEEILFSNLINAAITYAIGIIFAIIFAWFSLLSVHIFQHLFH